MIPDKAKRLKEKQDQIEARKKKHREEYEKAKKAVQLAAKDPNVQVILRHIAKITGFFKSNIVVNTNTSEINPLSTLHNESRRTVYLDLRRMMTDDIRRQIESKEE
jgi:hypothetical protein